MTIESRRSIRIAAGVLALVFLAGGLAGAAISLFADRPGSPHHRMMERIELPDVPPSPHGPDSLMTMQRVKADSLLESMGPRLKALMDSTNADIEALLTEEQRERFRAMQERRHEVLIRRRGPLPVPPVPPLEDDAEPGRDR